MKKCLFTLASFFLIVASTLGQEVKFEEYELDNGLHIILHQQLQL